MKSISIIGCGWFGLPLATELVKSGMRVVGTKRSAGSFQPVIDKGIIPVELDLAKLIHENVESQQNFSEFFNTDFLVINIPPRMRSGNKHYIEELQYLISLLEIKKYKKVIFISSTGVYPNHDKTMREEDVTAEENGNELLFKAEQLFFRFDNVVILRFAGLIGTQRHPGRFFSGKKEVSGRDSPVNLVHLNDCINAVKIILGTESRARIFNLCTPHHPSKKEFYSIAIQSLNSTVPRFVPGSAAKKQIDASLITKETEFEYTYSNLYQAIKDC